MDNIELDIDFETLNKIQEMSSKTLEGITPDAIKGISDFFTNDYKQIQKLSIEEKISILGLSEQRVNELKEMPVREISYNSDTQYQNDLKIINVDEIVGLARPFYDNNWLDVLSDKYCHKVSNFTNFNKDTFDMVLQCEQIDDYPSVVEEQGGYYISVDGLHRLTIAKCLGNKKAKVIVQKSNDWIEKA